ncbi:MAG: hypothetical protein ACYDEP_13910 [Acidimicrobiales bacterium]
MNGAPPPIVPGDAGNGEPVARSFTKLHEAHEACKTGLISTKTF